MKNVCRFDKKYFPNVQNGICPVCGGLLEDININTWEYTKDDTADTGNTDFNDDFNDDFNNDFGNNPDDYDNPLPPIVPPEKINKNTGRININGIIQNHKIEYENRSIFEKLFDGIVYGQPFSNTYHTFLVNNQENNLIYSVTAYGSISGRGANIIDGQHVFISGKRTKNGIIFCERMQVDSGGMLSDVRFYTDIPPHPLPNPKLFNVVFILIAMIAVILAYNFIPAFKAFIALWIAMTIMAAIATSMLKMRVNFGGLLIIGFVLSLLLENIGGLGTLVAGYLSATSGTFLILALLIFGIIQMIKSCFK